jgi:hypothetical protein
LSYAPEIIGDFQLSIANLSDIALLLIRRERKSEIGNWQSAMNVVAVEGIEPTSLGYRSSDLPLSYTANLECGGKRSATPLWIELLIHGIPKSNVLSKAPSLPAHSRVWLTRRDLNPHPTA